MIIKLIGILCVIESGNNAAAFNAKELAIGILQIRPIMVEDVNRIHGTSFKHEDCWDPATSIKIAKLYYQHYAREGMSISDLARMWQGGPKGHLKTATIDYGKRAEKLCGLCRD